MYKQIKSEDVLIGFQRLYDNAGIPIDPANTDYQQFKQAINDDTAQLEDAVGNLMTAEDAKAFVGDLP